MSVRATVGPGLPLPCIGGSAATHRVQVVEGHVVRRTTIHVVRWPLDSMRARLVVLDPPRTAEAWCREVAVGEAINGGFFTKPDVHPLGFVAIDGRPVRHRPFVAPWSERRAAIWIAADGRDVVIASRDELEARLARLGGSMLQSAPLLVRDGVACVRVGDDPEGLSTTCDEFDSDITAEPLPRMAIARAGGDMVGVAVDGRSTRDSGLLLHELAAVLVELEVDDALGLDGGSSASLVTAGRRRNRPRDEFEHDLVDGYPTATLLAVEPVDAATIAAAR